MEKKVNEKIDKVVDLLRKKGMEFTTKARKKVYAANPYNNITYNLVSSVGFAIAKNGVIVESYFPLEATGVEGKAKGEALAETTAINLAGRNDIVLILAAGEDYASYVQAKGKDVVNGSSDEFTAYVLQTWGAYR
ncbi:hypothetical protein [Pedobacter nyackensis]|nr:hypothetical protein [Pedobacter nyackensis]